MTKTRIAIIGLGRIGGSIGLALKRTKLDLEIVGHDKDFGTAGRAQKRGAVDKTNWNLIGACEGAAMIILALPLDGVKDTLAALKSYVQPGVIITDTAPTKAPVLEWANDLPRGTQFVGGHPVLRFDRAAGGHGIDAADATLFDRATYCLTPSVTADSNAVDTVANFARLLGAQPYFMDAIEHDGLAAGVEQLPALLATALASATTASQGWRELARLASVDFRVATDLAPQNEQSANEAFMAHRTDLIRWIDLIIEELRRQRGILERHDNAALKATIKAMVEKRDQWLSGKYEEAGIPTPPAESVSSTLGHFFVGGLAERGAPKRK
jgi:prephenate dehydrogenase